MARPRRYETAALKQRAYRERKRKRAKNWDMATKVAHHQEPTIDALRRLIKEEEEKPCSEAPALPMKPIIYRNDFGAVISESAWKTLQKKKEEAKEKGYTIDEYSQ